jgi:hypothetical protein
MFAGMKILPHEATKPGWAAIHNNPCLWRNKPTKPYRVIE